MNQEQNAGTRPVININLLGQFELRVGEVSIDDNINRSRKLWNLLAYIIVHRDRAVPQQELIELLWPEDESLKPGNALKTLLYRIRLLLEPLEQACDDELILSQRGSYSWNRRIPCVIDADVFEALCHRAEDSKKSAQQRIDLYLQAIELYRGDFLPKQSMEIWTVPFCTHYHELYLHAVKTLCQLLFEEGRHEEIVDISRTAIEVDALDETLHCQLIRALIHQGKDAAALNHYEIATDKLYRYLGVRPSEELRTLYLEIMKTQKALEMDLGIIQEELREAEAVPGAFVCEYGFFKEAYRLEARRAARYGMSVFIGLITVVNPSGEVPPLELLNPTMDQLLGIIKASLRKGDAVARYSGAQYVLMLPALTFEDGRVVIERIVSNFYRRYKKQFLKVHYKLQQLMLDP
ncbi:MAG: SARP family transcriptional regulator [Clostridiales bacterium]|nr:SARP family transcriptional regulator [Clostridiales bacterium]